MTSAHRFAIAVAVGTGSLLALFGLYFVGQVASFENPDAPAWQSHYWVWGILGLVIPGVLVGLVANHNRWIAGAITGMLGCGLAGTAIWVVLVMKQSLGVESWLDVILVVVTICIASAIFAWLSGVAQNRWSPNNSLERTREG